MRFFNTKFKSKRIVAVGIAMAVLCGTVLGVQLTASAMPDFDVAGVDGYAYYGFHEVEETPLVDFSFEDMADTSEAVSNGGSAGNGSVANPDKAALVDARWGTGKALQFTGADNYVSAPDLGQLDALTFATWLKVKDLKDLLDSNDATREMVLLDTATGNGAVTLKLVHTPVPEEESGDESADDERAPTPADILDTKLVLTIKGNAGGALNEDSVFANNQNFDEYDYTYAVEANTWMSHMEQHCWIHISFIYDPAAKTVTFYTNGKLDSTKTFTTAVKPVLNDIRIGAGHTARQYLDGVVDDVRIYDEVLTAEDIEALADFERDMWANKTADQWTESTTVLYVDGTNGDDSNPGTKDQPFATFKKGIESIKSAGTKLIVAPGVYREGPSIMNVSGTELEPIIIEAEVPGETIINASTIMDDWKMTTMEDVYVHDWDYYLVYFGGPGNEFVGRSDMIYVDGEPTEPVFSLEDLKLNTYYLDVDNMKVYYMTKKLLGKFTAEVPDLCIDEENYTVYSLLDFKSNDYIVLRGMTFTNVTNKTDVATVDFGVAKHILVEDCVFKNCSGNGVGGENAWFNNDNFAEDWLVRRCQFINNGGGTVGGGFRWMNGVVEHCEFIDTGWKIDWGEYSSADPATSKNMFTKNITFRNCLFDGNHNNDLWFDNWNWNTDINGCDFYNNNSGISVYTEINPTGLQIRNCTLEGIRFSNSDGTIIDNNIIYNRSKSMFTCWSFDMRCYTGKDTILTNNVFGFGRDGRTVLDPPAQEAFYDMYADGNKFYIERGKATDKVFNMLGDIVDYHGFVEAIGDKNAEYLTENPFLDDGTASVAFKDAASVARDNQQANYIPVVVSKPLRKEFKVSYTIWDYDTGEEIRSGVLEFGQFDRQQEIYVGDGTTNVLIELTGAKDIQLGSQTMHYQSAAE